MSVLLFSDLHIHPHKKKEERREDCLKVLDWVFDVAKENSISNILFGGDLFHDRYKIDVPTYQRTFETLKNRLDGKIKLWLLLGNHDMWFNDDTSISSVFPLASLPGIRIISKPEQIVIDGVAWDFIPFTHNPLVSLETLIDQPETADYALGHIALHGAKLHGTTMSDVVIEHDNDMKIIDSSVFKRYKQVFLGHYHGEQRIDNVEYIGSPLELSFGECYQEKHLIVFDHHKNEKTYIVNKFSPKHLIVKQENVHKTDLNNNFVQVYVDGISSTELVELRNNLLKNKLGSLEIKQERKEIKEDVVINAKAFMNDENEMLNRYLEEIGFGDLDKNKLLTIGKQICEMNTE